MSESNLISISSLGFSVPTVTEPTDDDDDSDWEDEDDSSEADDDGRVYKNPRNSPSTECPRNEEQATLLVKSYFKLFKTIFK